MTRVNHLADVVREIVPMEAMVGRDVYHYSIPTFDACGEGQWERGDDIGSAKLRVRGGELLISRLNPRKSRVLITHAQPGLAVCSSEFVILRPKASTEVRFLRYAFLAEAARQLLDSSTQSVTRSQQRVDPEEIAKLSIPALTLGEQRGIADFLDAETSRVDSAILLRQRLAELAHERLDGVVEHKVRAAATAHGEAPLRHGARIIVGIVITPAAWYADDGVPAIRGINVKPGRIDLSELVWLTAEGHRLHRKSELRSGDVVVVRTGQAGAAAVVPPDLDGANCIDLLRVRPTAALDSRYLELVLNSDWTQKHILEHSVGSIQAHFNVGALKELPVPVPPLPEQLGMVDELERARRLHDDLERACDRQVAALRERKQALITAAVTGQLDVAREIAEEAS